MSRNGKIVLLVLLAAAGLSLAAVAARRGETDHPVARITRDGEVLDEIELDRVGRAYSFVLEDERGSNTISVEQGRIRVSQADCPRPGVRGPGVDRRRHRPHRLPAPQAGHRDRGGRERL